ncbi:DUF1127 domain-containing protein [Bosea sp. 124]|uniref:DUF1127 domain-containing protein n=1 Tax=Bosea sp. 124 TaxID=2135642 RepID=UPI000D3A0214|nr:DUF1127 domain-containing protein [Bosea sp. 124]PTM41159.1 uncharacterized protein YjiS (DUF1127 family) [Bosea sp. 124]
MYALKSDFLYDIDDLTDTIRPRRKTVLDRLVGRLAVGQIFREQFLYEVHGPFVASHSEEPRRPPTAKLIGAALKRLRDIVRNIRSRRAASELSRLDDRILKDIGLTRSQIAAAAFGALNRNSDS